MITAKTTCKWCGVEFMPGRKSRTYCSNACKQTAYYNRKKGSFDNDVTQTGIITNNRLGVTHHIGRAMPHDFKTITPINKSLPMEQYEPSREDREQHESEPTQGVNVMGMQVDKTWVNGLLESLPEEEQRQLSCLLLETISDTFPDLTNGIVTHSYGSNGSPEVYRMNANNHEESEEEDDDDVDYDGEQNDEDEIDEADREEEEDDDSSHLPTQAKSSKRGKRGSYLNRFSSPRIRQGLTIWEELSVTIPAFMEDYVLAYAADAGMLIHQAGSKTGGLVTVHILFHLSHHRRPVCRLLDLVLEAEDGTLKKGDFMPGGAFAASEEGQAAPSHEANEIDYDCFDDGMKQRPFHQVSHRNATPGRVLMYNNAAMQMSQSAATRRA